MAFRQKVLPTHRLDDQLREAFFAHHLLAQQHAVRTEGGLFACFESNISCNADQLIKACACDGCLLQSRLSRFMAVALVEGNLHGSTGVEFAGLPSHWRCRCLWPDIRIVHKAAIGGEAVADLTTHNGVQQFVVLAVGGKRHLIADGHV